MNYEHDDHHLQGCAARRGHCAERGVNEKLRNLEDDARDWIDVPRESRAGGGGPGGGQGCHGGYHVEYRYGIHSSLSLVIGMLLVILPHTVFLDHGKYSFLAHEIIRCYGAVTIGLGYMAYKIRSIKDGRIRRLLAETYFVVYGVTTLCLESLDQQSSESHLMGCQSLGIVYFCNIFLRILPILEANQNFRVAR